MDDSIARSLSAMAEASWIDEVPAEELDGLFIRMTGRERMQPPSGRGRYPSRLMLEGPITQFTDGELRVAARLARHLTAAGDLTYARNSGPFSHLRKSGDTWWASRMTWVGAGRPCATIEEAAGVLMDGIYADPDGLQPALDRFDAEHGHAPGASPSP